MVVKMLKKVCCMHIAQGKIRCSFLEIHFLPTLKQSFEDQIISFLSSFGHFCAALSSRKKPSQTGAYVAELLKLLFAPAGALYVATVCETPQKSLWIAAIIQLNARNSTHATHAIQTNNATEQIIVTHPASQFKLIATEHNFNMLISPDYSTQCSIHSVSKGPMVIGQC